LLRGGVIAMHAHKAAFARESSRPTLYAAGSSPVSVMADASSTQAHDLNKDAD